MYEILYQNKTLQTSQGSGVDGFVETTPTPKIPVGFSVGVFKAETKNRRGVGESVRLCRFKPRRLCILYQTG